MKTEFESINKILEKATNHLEGLKSKYNEDKSSSLLDKFTDEAKKAHLRELSTAYYNEGRKLKNQYIQEISNEYANLIKNEKENQRLQELESKKPKTQEQLLNDTNKLLYTTFILNNGSPAQVKNLLVQYGNDSQVIELIKAKINGIGADEKSRYSDVNQMISDLTRDKVNELLIQKNSYESYRSSDTFPTINALQPDLRQAFEVTKYIQDEFFK